MALEAVVFPQDLFGCYSSSKEFYTSSGGGWNFYEFGGLLGVEEEEKGLVFENAMNGEVGNCMNFNLSCSPSRLQTENECNANSSPSLETGDVFGAREADAPVEMAPRRKRRRRTKCYKNKEEVESQRMTHIAVERNRRKQMNEYLAVLRSLMPASYAQRGDQASIVGAAIIFVKELEQLLHTLEAQKHTKNQSTATSPFASFFTFPQYSSSFSDTSKNGNTPEVAADIEVTMRESHVNLKVRVKRQRKQLLRMVMGLQSLRLTTLHLNVTTAADQMILYSLSLKVEDDCQFTSVDEIATAMYQMVGRIQNEDA